jgi:histidinol phosphatase-like enzyme (inositol monophosphatase family)
MSTSDLADRLTVALDGARRAGALTLDYFERRDFAVERKADATPVTIADREAEQLLRATFAERFPADGVLGEEFGERPGTSGYRWIIDPIDGTKAFICGVPLYGTLIGLEHDGKSLLGVIHMPALDETIWGAAGAGAWHRHGAKAERPARVSNCASLAESVFLTSEVATFGKTGRLPAYQALEDAVRNARTWGDCYGYALVATGRAEIMIDPAMSVWDAAALQPIMEAAGGTFTDWRGRATIHSGEGVATNGHVLADVLKLLADHDPAQRS